MRQKYKAFMKARAWKSCLMFESTGGHSTSYSKKNRGLHCPTLKLLLPRGSERPLPRLAPAQEKYVEGSQLRGCIETKGEAEDTATANVT